MRFLFFIFLAPCLLAQSPTLELERVLKLSNTSQEEIVDRFPVEYEVAKTKPKEIVLKEKVGQGTQEDESLEVPKSTSYFANDFYLEISHLFEVNSSVYLSHVFEKFHYDVSLALNHHEDIKNDFGGGKLKTFKNSSLDFFDIGVGFGVNLGNHHFYSSFGFANRTQGLFDLLTDSPSFKGRNIDLQLGYDFSKKKHFFEYKTKLDYTIAKVDGLEDGLTYIGNGHRLTYKIINSENNDFSVQGDYLYRFHNDEGSDHNVHSGHFHLLRRMEWSKRFKLRLGGGGRLSGAAQGETDFTYFIYPDLEVAYSHPRRWLITALGFLGEERGFDPLVELLAHSYHMPRMPLYDDGIYKAYSTTELRARDWLRWKFTPFVKYNFMLSERVLGGQSLLEHRRNDGSWVFGINSSLNITIASFFSYITSYGYNYTKDRISLLPEHQLFNQLVFNIPKVSLQFTLQLQSIFNEYLFQTNTNKFSALNDYNVLDFIITKKIGQKGSVDLKALNLLNQDIKRVPGTQVYGRIFAIGATVQF